MVNIDWSIHIRLRRAALGRAFARLWLRGPRLASFNAIDVASTCVYDLRKGVPANDSTVDAVYHSHVLEHIDRDAVPHFLGEIRRALKPGGVHRIVVPDLEQAARAYVASLTSARCRETDPRWHDATVAAMIEQLVRREAHGTAHQAPARRWIENRLLGDARKRGETHQWMWDEVNLTQALVEAGFHAVQPVDYTESGIPGWRSIRLDEAADGNPYKPGSLYLEALA